MKIQTYILGNMRTNCYIISDEKSGLTAVVDPAAECDKIINKLKERSLKLEYILLTHSHFDHMMALEELRAGTGVKLCVHEHDSEAVINPELSYMSQFGGVNSFGKPAELLLKDGDMIELGSVKIKVIHTPGHTMGSVCYVIDDSIITGDTLFKGDIGRYDLYGGDYQQILESLKKLTILNGDYKLYPGHGSLTRMSIEKTNNIYLK